MCCYAPIHCVELMYWFPPTYYVGPALCFARGHRCAPMYFCAPTYCSEPTYFCVPTCCCACFWLAPLECVWSWPPAFGPRLGCPLPTPKNRRLPARPLN